MMDTINTETRRRLVLALGTRHPARDALARRVEEESAGRIRVVDPTDSRLERWRALTSTAGAPRTPVLLELLGDDVRAWEGRRMGAVLQRAVGRSAARRLMRILSTGYASLPSALRPLVGEPPEPSTLVKSRQLSGDELMATVRRSASNRDVRYLTGASPSSTDRSPSRTLAFEHFLRGGGRVRAVVFRASSTRILSHHSALVPDLPRSLARLWQLEGARCVLKKASVDGHPWPTTSKPKVPTAGPGRSYRVLSSINVSCLLNLAEAGGGCSLYFYALPEPVLRVPPDSAACAGGYVKPSRRCCTSFQNLSLARGLTQHLVGPLQDLHKT